MSSAIIWIANGGCKSDCMDSGQLFVIGLLAVAVFMVILVLLSWHNKL